MIKSRYFGLFLAGCFLNIGWVAMASAHVIHPQRGVAKIGTIYYVNSQNGNDQNKGTSQSSAWKSLQKVNSVTFQPGDKILFRAGTNYIGQLKLHGSGKAGNLIIISKYGKGNLPHIEGKGQYTATVLLKNVQYCDVQNLEISNKGAHRKARRAGVRVVVDNFGTAHHIHLMHLYVHDVNGSNVKSKGGGTGITWSCRGDRVKSRFDDLVIANNHLVRTDRNGITGSSSFSSRKNWFPSLHVVIRNNLLEDIGGDGIVPIACDGALVEYNVVHGARRRAQDFAAGIWPWSCDNTIVQYNEVSGMKGYRDGMGFDSDWNCRNTIIQYNYSHDNDGGFLLVCDNGASPKSFNTGNVGTIVRYNISQNDGNGSRIIQMAGPVTNTRIYNNTIYVGKSVETRLVLFNSWHGWSKDTHFYNNIFYVKGKAGFVYQSGIRKDNGQYVTSLGYGESTGNLFSHNVYYGNLLNYPDKSRNMIINPKLIAPGSGKNGRMSLKGYRLKKHSRARNAGLTIPDSGGKNFWGNPLPPDKAPNIGVD